MSDQPQQTNTLRCSNIHRGHNGTRDFQCPHPASQGKKWCTNCLTRQTNSRRTRASRGMCECCSNPSVEGKLRCLKHLQEARNRAKRNQEHRVHNGLCVECGRDPNPATHGTRCEMCWFSMIGRSIFEVKSRPAGRSVAPALRGLFHAQQEKCAYTGRRLVPGVNASLDHKIPKALGGTNELGNLQWVDTDVNRAKNALTEVDFLAMCLDVVKHMARS